MRTLRHSRAQASSGPYRECLDRTLFWTATDLDLAALTGLGYGYAVTGRRADAEKVLARLNELSKREFISPVWMAKIYSGLGEKDKAFESLERAYEDRSIVSVAYIKTNPMLDPLRSDPRFADLLRRMNLQP